jgi:hypothetical protein
MPGRSARPHAALACTRRTARVGSTTPRSPRGRERLAATIVVAFDACEDAGIGLSELQKVAFLHALLLQFDGFVEHVRSLEAVDRLLWDLGHLQ